MAVLKVQGMRCEKCVERISKALTDSAFDYSVSLNEKTVTINGDEETVKKAVEELEDLGFEVVE